MARGGISAFFGKVVRKHRRAQGLSQERLAERAEIHRTYVGLLEQGKRRPTLDVASQLANGLGMDLRELIGETLKAACRKRG